VREFSSANFAFMPNFIRSHEGAILTKSEAAELLRIKPRTLDEWMRLKRVPFFKLPSGTVRFFREQILDFIRKFEVSR
jgi:excisionase family DNA binding protein